ncbi:MAG TPA: cytochrome ubiquinol oxidase subunit I [Polyangia bacterium]|nr:cytochrome ubiquinol oxidase subunit I [Polyangia bacterium]
MDDLTYARSQMAMSLAFHIVFAAIGMAMPLLMVLAEWRFRRTGDRDYLALAHAWAKGTAVLFAVGAVSGTVLSFELGLLFPGFMRRAGAIIGMPFSLEGFAFFAEGIFLGLYLYGWERVRPRLHLAAGWIVAVSGLASAGFVLIANAWMNAPRGFRLDGAQLVDVDPLEAMRTPFAAHEIAHMALAAYMATAFAAAALHAVALRRAPSSTLHRKALGLALWVAIPCSLAQPLVGHWAGHQVAQHQPIKLAALEQHLQTRAWAPIRLGPIEIPGALSVLAFNRPSAIVRGLEDFPRDQWPPSLVHPAFQLMVAIGMLLALVAAWALWLRLRRRAWADSRRLLLALIVCAPLGFVAIEAGWVVTEVGRQPWVIYGVLRTAAGVTPMTGLWAPFVTFTLVYLGLAAAVIAILKRQLRSTVAP